MRFQILFLFLFTLARISFGQPSETDSLPRDTPFLVKSSLIALPFAFYTPETRIGGGLAGFFTFRFGNEPADSRPSQVQLGLAYTQEKQVLSYLPFEIYWNRERWLVAGELGYYRYVYRFFGIGNQTPVESEVFYANYPRVQLTVQRLWRPRFYAGLRYIFDDYRIVETETGKLLATADITGQAGGIISGLGLYANYDSRNQIFYPTEGARVQATLLFNRTLLGSAFNFQRLSLEGAKFISLSEKDVLALNGHLEFLGGQVPFQQLALIGGTRRLRGFFEGRFRDKNLWIAQVEYRRRIYGILGMTAFFGTGCVAPEAAGLISQQVHFAGGIGIRLRLSKKDQINFRIDLGLNEEGIFYPYLTVGEAF